MALASRLRTVAVFLAALAVTLTFGPDAEAQRRHRRDRGQRREDIMRLPVINAGPTYVDFPEPGQTATPRPDQGSDAAVPVPVPVPTEEPAPGRRRHRRGGRHHRRH
jgi:hypothetical protein